MRLLIVEDDTKMADLIRRGLEENGHSGRVAHDGVTGLSLARSIAPDAIVLDVMLPGLDGFDVTRRLRREGSAVPILMPTGRDRSSPCRLGCWTFSCSDPAEGDRICPLRGRVARVHGRGVLCRLKEARVGSSRVDLQACKLEYSIVSPK